MRWDRKGTFSRDVKVRGLQEERNGRDVGLSIKSIPNEAEWAH